MSLDCVVGGALLVTALVILIKSCRRVEALSKDVEILAKLLESIKPPNNVCGAGRRGDR